MRLVESADSALKKKISVSGVDMSVESFAQLAGHRFPEFMVPSAVATVHSVTEPSSSSHPSHFYVRQLAEGEGKVAGRRRKFDFNEEREYSRLVQ